MLYGRLPILSGEGDANWPVLCVNPPVSSERRNRHSSRDRAHTDWSKLTIAPVISPASSETRKLTARAASSDRRAGQREVGSPPFHPVRVAALRGLETLSLSEANPADIELIDANAVAHHRESGV